MGPLTDSPKSVVDSTEGQIVLNCRDFSNNSRCLCLACKSLKNSSIIVKHATPKQLATKPAIVLIV